MEWEVIIAGCILGFVMTVLMEDRSSNKKSCKPQVNRTQTGTTYRRMNPTMIPYWQFVPNGITYRIGGEPGVVPRRWDLSRLRMRRQNLVETWCRSVVGLLRLADKNLQSAQGHLKLRNYRNCIMAASTSVENVARALIHCFGGKPDPDSGQQEPLRLSVSRLQNEEKARFEEAVNLVEYIDRNRRTLEHPSTNEIRSHLFDESKAKEILRSASEIISLFKRIIISHFVTEIPELGEICPKCGSSESSIWGFNELTVNYQCNVCRHNWTR